MKYDYHIAVIGGGSAGLVVANGANTLGAKVLLIEGHKMGGDCLNYGCVPSKAFIHSGHVLKKLSTISDEDIHLDFNEVTSQVNQAIQSIAPHDSAERYRKMGIHVIQGYGQIMGPHRIKVNDQIITAKKIVIASGSSPLIPAIPGLKDVVYYTNENIFNLKEKPKHLIIIGSGPIGCELGQAFRLLGSEVTIISRSSVLFKKEDEEVGKLMHQVLRRDDIQINLNAAIKRIDQDQDNLSVTFLQNQKELTIQGDALLIAVGRKANTQNLNLDCVNISTRPGGFIMTNDKLQTACPSIYACGDVVGPYLFTHMAAYQASLVIQNAIFPIKKKLSYKKVPWVTYTYPEVARIGYSEKQAKEEKIKYHIYFSKIEDNDRSITNQAKNGFLKLITNEKNKLIGATMVSEHAGEQIALANMLVTKGMKINTLLSMTFPYPTQVEIYQRLALDSLKSNFKPWQKKLVEKLFFN